MPDQLAIKVAVTRAQAVAGEPVILQVAREQKPPIQVAARDAVEVDAQAITVIEVLREGPQGPPGSGGGSDAHYTHTQAVEAFTWTINHNLGKHPCIQVMDASSRPVLCEINYASEDQIILTHNTALAGVAYLN